MTWFVLAIIGIPFAITVFVLFFHTIVGLIFKIFEDDIHQIKSKPLTKKIEKPKKKVKNFGDISIKSKKEWWQ